MTNLPSSILNIETLLPSFATVLKMLIVKGVKMSFTPNFCRSPTATARAKISRSLCQMAYLLPALRYITNNYSRLCCSSFNC